VIAGRAMISRTETISVVHVKIGIRSIVMPGQRRLMTVTMKLNEAASEAVPRVSRPTAQKSICWPLNSSPVSGA